MLNIEKAIKILSEAYVQEALKNDKGDEATYNSYEINDFVKRGDNYTCYVTSVIVDYSLRGKREEVSYVVKLNPCTSSEAFAQFTKLIFEKESGFYFDLVPALNKVLNSVGESPLRVPKCYFASCEDQKQVIFLEDMRPKDYLLFDRQKGMSKNHVKLVLSELARLHAASQLLVEDMGTEEFHKRYPFLYGIFTKLGTGSDAVFKQMLAYNIQTGALIADTLKDYQHVSRYLKEIAPCGLDILKRESVSENPTFTSVLHGDCWNNNILFRYDADGNPIEVCFVDFQLNRFSSVALDLNYFLFTSLNGDTRIENQMIFLSNYHNTFQRIWTTSNNRKMRFTVEDVLKEYRSKHRFGLLMALMVLPMLLMDSAVVPDITDITNKNVVQKVVKVRQVTLDMIETSSILRPRLLDMFDELTEAGIIPSAQDKTEMKMNTS